MLDGPRDDVVVLVNPVSSGPYLARAFHEHGVHTLHLWEPHLRDRMAQDASGSWIMAHESVDDTLRALDRTRPLAVVAGSERGVLLADELAAHLGYPHNVLALSPARRDKGLMLEAIGRAGVPVPACYAIEDESELAPRLEELGRFPVVVKPKSSASHDGFRICHTAEAAVEAFRDIHQRMNLLGLRNTGALLQEFVGGTQYMVNTVSLDRRHLLTDYYVQRIDTLPDRSISRHLKSRTRLDPDDLAIVAYALDCLDALGVREGAGHTEVRMSASGPRIIEVNSRLMGPIMEPDPYHVAFGYSPQDLVAERYLEPERFHQRFETPYRPPRVLARSYLRTGRTGTIRRLRNLDQLRTLPGFHSASRLPRPGDRVSDPYLTSASTGVAYFVDADDTVVNESLDRLHDLEDAGTFFELVDD